MSDKNTHSQVLQQSVPSTLNSIDVDLASASAKFDEEISISINLKSLPQLQTEVMLESSLIQWLITRWHLAQASGTFEITHPDIEDEDKLFEQLASSAPGAVLALLPPSKVQGVNRRMAADFRQRFFKRQNQWPDLALSDSAFLLCVDAFPKYLPAKLYPEASHTQVTDWEGYRLLVDGLINSVAEESKIRGEILRRTDEISTILFELFKNTHDHARFNVKGGVIGESIRGVYSRFYPIGNFRELSSQDQDLNPVDNYLRALVRPTFDFQQRQPRKRDISGFLELSVFDTGPGLAAKWLGREISSCDPEAQYDAVVNCFAKGSSSSREGGRGFGLWRVLQQLRQIKGFIRVRTNQLHIYRQYAQLEDLLKEQHADGHVTPKEKLLDWRRQYTTNPSQYPSVDGTLISILLPLGEL